MMNTIPALQQQLDLRADPKTKAWWEGYLKHVIPFRGVKMADIRAVLHQWVQEEGIDRLPMQEQKELALALIRLDYTEDKLAGILFWQEILLPAGEVHWPDDLPRFAELFQQGFIYDWNTCDWFCVRVLGPLAEQQGANCAHADRGLAHGRAVVATPRGGRGLCEPRQARRGQFPRLHHDVIGCVRAAGGVARALRPDRRRLGAARAKPGRAGAGGRLCGRTDRPVLA